MKIILSRKGFDSEYGGQPSPILPDGTLLSFPIPSKKEIHKFSDLQYNGKSYYEIITELYPNTRIKPYYTCHLDPDVRKSIIARSENWKPAFGQINSAQGHLNKQNVGVNDIFLFFGWFKQSEIINGRYSYKLGSRDLHIIYGYLQISEKFQYGQEFPEYSKYHPHTQKKFRNVASNCVYMAKDNLSFDENYKGSSYLNFKPNLVLTKEGMSKSKWNLPDFFKDLSISYHTKDSFQEFFFQSAAKGQEFVIDADDKLIDWTKELILTN